MVEPQKESGDTIPQRYWESEAMHRQVHGEISDVVAIQRRYGEIQSGAERYSGGTVIYGETQWGFSGDAVRYSDPGTLRQCDEAGMVTSAANKTAARIETALAKYKKAATHNSMQSREGEASQSHQQTMERNFGLNMLGL